MPKENKETTIASEETSKKIPLRGRKKFRIILIAVLMIIVAVLFFVWEKARIFLAIAFVTLLAALGLEVSENDWDLGTLMETGSFQESKIMRDESGNFLYDIEGNIVTDSSKGKQADEYNCDDFSTQPQAQTFFEKVSIRYESVCPRRSSWLPSPPRKELDAHGWYDKFLHGSIRDFWLYSILRLTPLLPVPIYVRQSGAR